MEKASNDSMPSIAAAAEEERNLALHRGHHPKIYSVFVLTRKTI
jgi:hypothetical protein